MDTRLPFCADGCVLGRSLLVFQAAPLVLSGSAHVRRPAFMCTVHNAFAVDIRQAIAICGCPNFSPLHQGWPRRSYADHAGETCNRYRREVLLVVGGFIVSVTDTRKSQATVVRPKWQRNQLGGVLTMRRAERDACCPPRCSRTGAEEGPRSPLLPVGGRRLPFSRCAVKKDYFSFRDPNVCSSCDLRLTEAFGVSENLS